MDIVVTVPASMRWVDYLEGVAAAHQRREIAHFKTGNLPQQTKIGERCYILHTGFIRGWMKIIGLEAAQTFFCSIARETWTGNFIDRECIFHPIPRIPMDGFQGFRYFNIDNLHTCHAEACGKVIPPKMLFCRTHWAMVPPAMQAEVWAAYRPGQEIDKLPSAKYLEVQARVVDHVAHVEYERIVG